LWHVPAACLWLTATACGWVGAMTGDDEDPTDFAEYEVDASEVEGYSEAEGHEEYDHEAEVDVGVLAEDEELARGSKHQDEGVENVETTPVDRKAPTTFAPSRGGTSKYSQRYGDPPPPENVRPPRPMRDVKGKGRGRAGIESAISGPAGAMQIKARQALRHEGEFEELMSKLDLYLKQLDKDNSLIVSDLDISQNLLTKSQFEKLFAMLARDSICVQRFRLFGCPSLDDEVMRVIADWIRETTDETAPSELHLSDCAITSEGFLHLMCAIEDCDAFPLKQGRTVRPLFLRIENNYIEDSIIQEKVDDGIIMTFAKRSDVSSASTSGPLGRAKIQLLVLGRDYRRGKGRGGRSHDKESAIDNLPRRKTRSLRPPPPRYRSPERSFHVGYRSSRSHRSRHSSSGNGAHDNRVPNSGRRSSVEDKGRQSSRYGRANSTHVHNSYQRDSRTSRKPSNPDGLAGHDRYGHGSYTRAAGVSGNSTSIKRRFRIKDDFNLDAKRFRRYPALELPPEWEEHFSKEHGTKYYWNRETCDSQWEIPRRPLNIQRRR